MLGGRMEVSSVYGEGSRFEVLLPAKLSPVQLKVVTPGPS